MKLQDTYSMWLGMKAIISRKVRSVVILKEINSMLFYEKYL